MGKRVKVNFVGDTPDVIGQLDGSFILLGIQKLNLAS
jgi:hypothetical protein